MSATVKTNLLRFAKFAVLAVVLAFVVLAMRRELSKASAEDWAALKPDAWLVVAAGLCLVGVNSVQMLSYRALLRGYGARPTWPQMAAIAWIPPLGKYVPGKVVALLGAMAMLRRFGIGVAIAVSVVIMLDAFSVLVGLIVSSPLLMEKQVVDYFPAGRWLGPLCIAGGLVALSPPVFGRLLGIALRLLKRPALMRMPTWGEYVVPVLCAAAQWLFAGGALWLMSRSVAEVSPEALPRFLMIAACAMTLSYLALLAPGGLGVREALFMLLLPPLLADAPTGTVTIVTIGMRLLQTIVEVCLAGLGALALRHTSPAEPSVESAQ
jgi:glycosyltransferase 2 family protein